MIFICQNAGPVLTQPNFLCLFAHYLGFLHGIPCLKIFNVLDCSCTKVR